MFKMNTVIRSGMIHLVILSVKLNIFHFLKAFINYTYSNPHSTLVK